MILLARTQITGSRESGARIVRSWHVETEDEIFECVRDNLSYRGFSAVGDWSADNWNPDTTTAGFEVSITYGSVEVNGPDNSDEEYGGEAAKWNFEPAFQQTAIEKHPEIDFLIKNYAGEEDPSTHRVTFKRLLDALPSENARGLLGKNYKDADGKIKNPLYGFNESGTITMGGIASARYVTSDITSAMRGVGKVFNRLPGNAPEYGIDDDRNFLKMPPSISEAAREENGARWHEIQHQFMMSDIGGWPAGVYKFIEV